MNRVITYKLTELGGFQIIVVPATTQFLSVSDGGRHVLLWALVPENTEPTVSFEVASVGYLGLLDGSWHFVGKCDHMLTNVHVFLRRKTSDN